jgi:glycosyltransferase involved in cell wall biosynthesis
MKQNEVLISVITIVKNNDETLSRAIDSVLVQPFHDYEYIIVNDGSTDSTGSLIDGYAESNSKIKPVHLPDCIGRSMARNAGLDKAAGQYVLFLDSDDYLSENALNDLYLIAQRYKADIVYGRMRCFDNKTGDWISRHYTDEIINRELHNIRIDDHLSLVNNHHIVGRLYRNEFLKNNKIRFSTTRRNGEDVLFSFYTVFFADNISIDPSKKVYFYCLGNYIDTANESKLIDARDNVLETINYAVKHGSASLQSAMWKKGVVFSSDLSRASKVYKGNDLGLISYISSLRELVSGTDEKHTSSLSKYQNEYLSALRNGDALKAYQLWNAYINRNSIATYNVRTGATDVRGCIRLIAARMVYRLQMTPIWRLLLPLRWLVKKILKLNSNIKSKPKNYNTLENNKSRLKVSVIIPVFNVEQYLRQCLASVVSQSLRDIEIICINDASPDNSQSILDEYAAENSRFMMLRHENNKGLAASRNTGLDVATGEYIYFLDSDDYLANKNVLERLYSAACVDDADEVIGGVLKWHEHTGESYLDWHKHYLKREIHGEHLSNLPQLRCNVVAWNKLIKKSLIDQYSIRFDERLRKHEDNPFSCMVHILSDKISIIPNTAYIYRQARGDSIMNVNKKEDAYHRNTYCSEIFKFIESDEKYHVYREIYYPMYLRQLIQGAQILSQFTPSQQEKSSLMSMWFDTLSVITNELPGVPDNLKEIVRLIGDNKLDAAWNKSLLI